MENVRSNGSDSHVSGRESGEGNRRVLRPRSARINYADPDPVMETADSSSSDDESYSSAKERVLRGSASDITESSSDDSGVLFLSEIMVGEDYQAVIPRKLAEDEKRDDCRNDDSFCMWKPPEALTDKEVDQYLVRAATAGTGKKWTQEQLLGLLHHCNYDSRKALGLVSYYRSTTGDYWPKSARKKFDEAVAACGKDFYEISVKWFPDRPVRSLIQYYYERKMHLKSQITGGTQGVSRTPNKSPRENGASSSFLTKPAFRRLSTAASGNHPKTSEKRKVVYPVVIID